MNWERLREISPGDWFVAYLKPQTLYAIGKVITPRRRKTDHDRTDTIRSYLDRQRSHDHRSGYVYYTPVFYEDFSDKWRHPEDELTRYPQRVDVEEWRYCVPGGVSVPGLNKISPNELRLAVFKIPKGYFQKIARALTGGRAPLLNDQEAREPRTEADDSVVEAHEKSYAKSQGFLLDSKTRKALENYAMDAAKRYFDSLGYVVEDHSAGQPYDLLCLRGKERLYVEVKGTQTNGDGIILTTGEVKFARRRFLIEVCGRAVSVTNTDDGIRAVQKGRPIDPDSGRHYLENKFGDDLKAVRSAMQKLAKAYKPQQLGHDAYALYERFRPEIPAGKKGWGAKGDLDLGLIGRLAKEKP